MDNTTYKSTVTRAFNQAAASYDRMGVEFFTPMGRRLVAATAPRLGDRVLDIGCGLGACMFPAAEAVGPSGTVLGIDIAESMVHQANAEASARGVQTVKAVVMDAEHPRFPKRSFDAITGSYSVIFLPEAPRVLARYASLLTEKGRIGFTSPVFTDECFPFLPPVFTELIPRSLLQNLPPEWQPDELTRRFNSWLANPAQLERTMLNAGYNDIHILDEPVTMVAESGPAWVKWSHTQGMRLLWEHLPAPESAALAARLSTALDAMRSGAKPLRIEVPVRFVTAAVAR